jgi:hypothetical protein
MAQAADRDAPVAGGAATAREAARHAPVDHEPAAAQVESQVRSRARAANQDPFLRDGGADARQEEQSDRRGEYRRQPA